MRPSAFDHLSLYQLSCAMHQYPFREIERKWQRYWEEHRTFCVDEDPAVPAERRRYVLDMFPYPSAAGLHVGHPEGYTATDIYCRYLRMRGYAVLHPMGFDSFGLPAENYAIETGTHPRATTEANIARFREQIKAFGFSYDWEREVSTHDPDYYRWTQWIFLQLYKQGLAYLDELPVWFCPALGTVLANEEVMATDDGPRSERGNHPVERRSLRQWVLKITDFAEELLAGLDELDWPEPIKTMQRNWIGKSEGARILFKVLDIGIKLDYSMYIEVFTTRPDTLFGATFVVLAPEHPYIERIVPAERKDDVAAYIAQVKNKSDLERTDLAKEKSGIFSGAYARHPITGAHIPIWIGEYVLISYGEGAIMSVPAHDERDYEFAVRHQLPIVSVYEVENADGEREVPPLPYTGEGWTINSGTFDEQRNAECAHNIIDWLEEKGYGEAAVTYKLRDWIFSRQRYWGEPIPISFRDDGKAVPLDEAELPLLLPEVSSYQPSGDGKSPLSRMDEWMTYRDARHGDGLLHRESNTMPQWAGSCWYYLRYIDPHNSREFALKEKMDYWLPVDLYVGGAEHAVLHLLYARFWHRVLYKIGAVSCAEPFRKLVNQGTILGENGVKMSKSLGNVVNPDEIIAVYGADALRLYEMFMGPLEASKPWNTNGLVGMQRFLNRVWRFADTAASDSAPPQELVRVVHQTIRKVGEDVESLNFNTAISQLMICLNAFTREKALYRELWASFVRMLSVFAPHIGEELWERLGNEQSLAYHPWPEYDPAMLDEEEATIVIQVNGKVRATMECAAGMSREQLIDAATAHPVSARYLRGVEPRKIIVVPDRLVNFVIG